MGKTHMLWVDLDYDALSRREKLTLSYVGKCYLACERQSTGAWSSGQFTQAIFEEDIPWRTL